MNRSPSLKVRSASSGNLNMVYIVATLALSTTLAVSALLFLLSARKPDGANDLLKRVGRPVLSQAGTDCSSNSVTGPVTLSAGEYEVLRPSSNSFMSPQKAKPKQFTPEEINQLVTGEGKVYGKVEKKGMLPMEAWMPPYNESSLESWVWTAILGREDGDMSSLLPRESPPKAGICTLLFNPIYKLIFVKNTKVAGTSLFLKFGGFCEGEVTLENAKENPNCLWKVTDVMKNGLESLGYNSWEEMWADYQVVTLVRNPYDRAGSSYDYTLGLRENREGTCRDPTFQHYTSKPYVIGLQDTLYGCGDATHDFYHVEPQHTCLLDKSDNLVVDWVIRVNSLEQDLTDVLGALNNVRMEGAPELEDGIGWEQRGPIADDRKQEGQEKAITTTSRHKQKFEDCGSQCIHNLNQYYKKDFEILKYPMDVV